MLMNDARGNNVTLLFDYTQVEKNKITGFPYAVYLDGVEYHTSYVKDVYFILVDNNTVKSKYGNEFVILEHR